MNKFLLILTFLFTFVFLFTLHNASYAQSCPTSCTYSQDDDDPTTKIKCYTGICTSSNCDFNLNCKYEEVPAECGINVGAERPCPAVINPSPTIVCTDEQRRVGACSNDVDCGRSDERCCTSRSGENYCNGRNYPTKGQDAACLCKSWEAGASIPPPQVPCATGKFIDGKCEAIPTGLGFDIETKPAAFMKRVFSILLSLAGGIALILIIMSGYKLMTSQGNPEAIQGARETITSAIVGLLFIIFSFLIFTVITQDILKIPFIK